MGGSVLCVRCGYDLSGLNPAGSCPECGVPVARSLRGDLLSAAEPAWLKRVRRGLTLISVGCVVFLVRIPVIMLLDAMLGEKLDAVPSFWEIEELVTGSVSWACLLVGVVLATALEPRLSLTEQPLGLRRLTRGAATGTLGIAWVLYSMKLIAAGGSAGFSRLLQTSFLAILAVTVVGVTFYFGHLAERMSDAKLAPQIKARARNAGICFALAIVINQIAPGGRPFQGLDAHGLARVLAWFDGILTFASMAYAIALMSTWWSFRKIFRDAVVVRGS